MSAEADALREWVKEDYVVRGVALLRKRYPIQTAGMTDAGLACAYSYWSEEVHCAGWMMLGNYEADSFALVAFKDARPPVEVTTRIP